MLLFPRPEGPNWTTTATEDIILHVKLCGRDYYYSVTVGFKYGIDRAIFSKNDFLNRFPAINFETEGVQVRLPENRDLSEKSAVFSDRKTYKGRLIESRGDFWYFLDTGEKVQF
jgi:hypothetical protein